MAETIWNSAVSVYHFMMDNLVVINILLSLVIVFFQRRSPQTVWNWLLLLYFIPILGFVLYLLIGQVLFGGDWEKTFLFGIVLSVLHLAGYTSTHTLASMLLLRIWQGKAVCASFALPLFFYLFYQIMKKEAWKRWIPLLYVAGVGTCMLSGIGIVTAPVLLAVYGVLDFCYYRNWRKTLAIWLAAVPCVIFLGYYLM